MIKDDVKTLSNAIDLLIRALDNPRQVQVDMSTFGKYDPAEKVCIGCAATLVLQELTGISYDDAVKTYIDSTKPTATFCHVSIPWHRLAEQTPYSFNDIDEFQAAIDSLRSGYLYRICDFLELSELSLPQRLDLPNISSTNWPDVRREYVNARDELREMGM